MARSDGQEFYLETVRQLIAAGDDGSTVLFGVKTGTASGIGNQGTANSAMPVGQAGTAGDQLGTPRTLQGGRQQ